MNMMEMNSGLTFVQYTYTCIKPEEDIQQRIFPVTAQW